MRIFIQGLENQGIARRRSVGGRTSDYAIEAEIGPKGHLWMETISGHDYAGWVNTNRENNMGITIVQKSDLRSKRKRSKIALVLSGGAITGGAFKLGGLQALNGFMLNRNIVDFDMFIGTSAGSFLATYLANGITTDQLANSFEGKDGHVDPIMISEFYA